MQYLHLVARIRQRRQLLVDWDRAAWLWLNLQHAFPMSLAQMLMPEHLHLIVPAGKEVVDRLSQVCRVFAKRFGLGRGTWDPVPEPREIPDTFHLQRQVRYVHLNPSRRELTRDPLEWVWSTHRDWLDEAAPLGARVDPLLKRWKWTREKFHAYVSSDPTCSVLGTPYPKPPRALTLPRDVSMQSVLRAVVARSRRSLPNLLNQSDGRDLLISVASELTPYSQADLARSLDLSKSAVTYALRRAVARPELKPLIADVRQALLDPRYLRLGPPPEQLVRLLNDPFKIQDLS